MKLGAFDYIFKPVDVDELIETIESAFLKKTDGK
jgi:FixJ family two-component response regulator